jgi:formate C-acetyltransferase
MKRLVKQFRKQLPGLRSLGIFYRRRFYDSIQGSVNSTSKKILKIISFVFDSKYISAADGRKWIRKLLAKTAIMDNPTSPFFYSIDEKVCIVSSKTTIGNLTPDYAPLLEYSITALLEGREPNQITKTWEDVRSYCISYIQYLENTDSRYKSEKINHLQRIITHKAETFYEALQRILFTNQLIWQEGHSLIGLGRLDKMLYPYYQHDLEKGVMYKEEAVNLIKEFLLILHDSYRYKSSSQLGDTGQIIILGGFDGERYLCNDLTFLFIQVLKELQIPDPKILVRVHRLMPGDLLEESVKCIQTGIGSPLFANDEVIIPALVGFGYEKEDAFDYGVSACWEPLIIGKSSDANNICSINYMKPMREILFADRDVIDSYYIFLERYKEQLAVHVKNTIEQACRVTWEQAPLLSLFVENCPKTGLDIADGGAKYNNYGFTTAGMANTVNSLLNIQKYVFELKTVDLSGLRTILSENYADHEDVQKLFRNETIRYGIDDQSVLTLTNDITRFTSELIERYTPRDMKRRIKFGLSSPSYISDAHNIPATPDGRNKNDPFAVHISNDKAVDFTGIFQFAAKLDYSGNRFNGNVIDIIIPPYFIENNFTQFVSMLYASFVSGIFEMQFNVVSSGTLIRAKKTPSAFPNLIVRVWGFSAYFNDLPEEYKDVIIRRTLEHERACQ